MTWAIDEKGYSQRRACALIGIAPKTYRYTTSRGDDSEFRERLRHLAAERRRFGYRRLHILLLSISAEPGPGISVQSRPTPRLSSGRPRSPRRGPARVAQCFSTSDAATRVGRHCGPPGTIRGLRRCQVRFLKRQLSLPVSRMSQ